MRPKLLTFFLIALSIFACNNESSFRNQETEIINDILFPIVSDDFFFPLTPPPPAEKSEISEFKVDSAENNYNKNYKKLIEKLDTTKFVISIEDSTEISFNKTDIDERLKENGYTDLIFPHKLPKTVSASPK
jgi:hypothetical protein